MKHIIGQCSITYGNAEIDGNAHRDWFVGEFMEADTLCHDEILEIKWGNHKSGEFRPQKDTTIQEKTLSILISGRFGMTFANEKEIILEKRGDYVITEPNIPHTAFAYKDSVIITVRWKNTLATKEAPTI